MGQRSLIFDIGCNTGQDSEFYLRKGFTVVAVEASPDLCVEIKRRFADEIAEGRFILVEKAIAEQAGEVEFYANDKENGWGTIRTSFAEKAVADGAPPRKIVVPAVSFPTLIEKFGVPYYLKIDIQGADLLCIEGLAQFRERPKFVSFESSLSLPQQRLDELSLIRKLGYRRFKFIDQTSIPSQAPPSPAREGVYVDHHFEFGATGLFGAELPGAWLTFGGLIGRYAFAFARNKRIGLFRRIPVLSRFGGHGCWYDLHAALPS